MRRHPSPSPEATLATRQLLHEVRTPIGQIIGYAEMVEEAVVDLGEDGLVQDMRHIQEAARKLLSYLEGLFLEDGGAAPAAQSSVRDFEGPPVSEPTTGALGSLLVVDDDPGQSELLARRLTQAGYAVTQAPGGRQALHALEPGGFDLVLLDIQMPGMSGLEVLDAIRRTRSITELPVVMASALAGRDDVMEALGRGANDYVTKPFDIPVVLARVETQLALAHAAGEVANLAQQLEMRNAFIRQTFGRYLSEEIVSELLDAPAALEIGGEQRRISVLFCDLSGFTAMTESLSPREVVSVLNGFLGAMVEKVQAHGGTVDEFLGDSVLAFFGAPIARTGSTEAAVAAAIDMQCAIPELNSRFRRSGLPEISMSVGIATGDVIVGNIGSASRMKYGAVGSPVNLAARIEAHAAAGEVLIDPATHEELGETLDLGEAREVRLKGFDAPVRLYGVVGIRGSQPRRLPTPSV